MSDAVQTAQAGARGASLSKLRQKRRKEMERERSNLVQFPCGPQYLTEEDLNDPCSGNVLDIPLPPETH